MYKQVRNSRLCEQIVQQIEDSILKGTLRAGDQLPSERELVLKFGVGRTAVREAVKLLRERELRGTFITNAGSDSIDQPTLLKFIKSPQRRSSFRCQIWLHTSSSSAR